MVKTSTKGKALSAAFALAVVASLSIPFVAYADDSENIADQQGPTQQEQAAGTESGAAASGTQGDAASENAQASSENSGVAATQSEEGADAPVTLAAAAKVAEAGGVQYGTIADAIKATNNGTVKLLADAAEDVVIPSGKTIILDLNGCTLTNKGSDTIAVEQGGSLTIQGSGTVDNVTHGKSCVFNNGTVVLNGGTYTRSAEAGSSAENSGGNSYYNLVNHGAMTINDGVTVSSSGAFSSLVENGYYNYSSNDKRSGYVAGVGSANPSLTINGGNFSGGINTLKNDDGGECTVNGGEFKNVAQHAVMNANHIKITAGKFGVGSNFVDCNLQL